MFRNYLKTAWRNIKRNKFFTIINLLCLSLGITFSMLIGVYIFNQLSVNSNLKNVDNQYILKSKWKQKGMGLDIVTLPLLGRTLMKEFPSLVKNYYSYNPVSNVVSANDVHLKEDISIGDTTFISMYGLPLLHGNTSNPFPNSNSAVITENVAIKLFGTKNAINKRITIKTLNDGDDQAYLVSGVLKEIPHNSVFNLIDPNGYQIYVPSVGNRYYPKMVDPLNDWSGTTAAGFIELTPNANIYNLNKAIKQTLLKYTDPNIYNNLEVEVLPIKDYYLNDNHAAIRKFVNTLSLITFFILLMAVFNFININIGTSTTRLKEVGIRKLYGSSKKQIIGFSLTEALLLAIIASVFSLFFYEGLKPYFSQIFSIQMPSFWHFTWKEIAYLVVLVLFIGLFSGIYPAYWISNIRTVQSIKGKFESVSSKILLRKILLATQFSLGIFAFICARNISNQISFIFSKDLGYDKEQLMVITALPKQWDAAGLHRMESIKQGLLTLPAVQSATLTFNLPDNASLQSTLDLMPINGSDKPVVTPFFFADEDYGNTFKLKMQTGTFLRRGQSGYIPGQLVVNETAAKALGLNMSNAVGKTLQGTGWTISGVLKDYNFESMHDAIGSIAIANVKDANTYRFMVVKLNTGNNIEATIKTIQEKWKSLAPEAPFDYTFMDEKFADLYKTDIQLKKAFNAASILNIIIIFLGLSGIISYTLEKRKKEIAIRKVLGADLIIIVFLFIKEYALLLLLSNLVAWPLAYYVSQKWLQGFAYRTSGHWLDYVSIGLLISLLTCVLIVFESLKTITANPIKDLRSE